MPKSWIGWAFLLIVVILIFKNPAGTATTVRHWWDSASTFVTTLVA